MLGEVRERFGERREEREVTMVEEARSRGAERRRKRPM